MTSSTPVFDAITRSGNQHPPQAPPASTTPTAPTTPTVDPVARITESVTAAFDRIAQPPTPEQTTPEQRAIIHAVADAITRAVTDAITTETERILRNGITASPH